MGVAAQVGGILDVSLILQDAVIRMMLIFRDVVIPRWMLIPWARRVGQLFRLAAHVKFFLVAPSILQAGMTPRTMVAFYARAFAQQARATQVRSDMEEASREQPDAYDEGVSEVGPATSLAASDAGTAQGDVSIVLAEIPHDQVASR